MKYLQIFLFLTIISAIITIVAGLIDNCDDCNEQEQPTTVVASLKIIRTEFNNKSSNVIQQSFNNDKQQPSTSSSQQQHQQQQPQNIHQQTMNKLKNYLNYQQKQLIENNPGTLLALAKGIKMAIIECQYQMRHEPWDCPIYGFGVRPTEIFGKLMSRHFKETSFIHSLLSSAIAHSVTRACTESMIATCTRGHSREGGYRENFEFGSKFASEFMAATLDYNNINPPLTPNPAAFESNPTSVGGEVAPILAGVGGSLASNSINDVNINNNLIGTGSGQGNDARSLSNSNELHQQLTSISNNNNIQHATSFTMEPMRREKKIRNMINVHNDEAGRLRIREGIKRECKCHGLSGACTMHTCWLKLPPFREVAQKLHDSLDQAIKIIYVGHYPSHNNRQKSLTSMSTSAGTNSSIKKSNKKRSSAGPQQQQQHHQQHHHQQQHQSTTSSLQSMNGYRRSSTFNQSTNSTSGNVRKRPVARSIGISASTIKPTPYDLLYYEESPDFCVPNDRYNIKGTKGRICSEAQNAVNNCERLCCGRGYKKEVRVEKYKCECQFKYCCKLECKTCTRQKVLYKCL